MTKGSKDGAAKQHIIGATYWLFLILFIISALLAVYGLRQNNRQMVDLREAVYQADRQNGDTESALTKLRAYVHSHMNTNLSSGGNTIKPPIQLKYTYERLQSAEQKRVDDANSHVYTQAQEYCQAQNPTGFSGRGRVPCVQEYVTTHGTSAQPIPASLYKFDFVSPFWSPDLAGLAIVASTVFFILFLFSFVMDRLVRSRIKNQDL